MQTLVLLISLRAMMSPASGMGRSELETCLVNLYNVIYIFMNHCLLHYQPDDIFQQSSEKSVIELYRDRPLNHSLNTVSTVSYNNRCQNNG